MRLDHHHLVENLGGWSLWRLKGGNSQFLCPSLDMRRRLERTSHGETALQPHCEGLTSLSPVQGGPGWWSVTHPRGVLHMGYTTFPRPLLADSQAVFGNVDEAWGRCLQGLDWRLTLWRRREMAFLFPWECLLQSPVLSTAPPRVTGLVAKLKQGSPWTISVTPGPSIAIHTSLCPAVGSPAQDRHGPEETQE